MKQKLTLVSVVIRGHRQSRFVMGRVDEDGKTRIHPDVVNDMTKHLSRGRTYSLGA